MEKLRILTTEGVENLRRNIESNMDFYLTGNSEILDSYFDEANTYETFIDYKPLDFHSPVDKDGKIFPDSEIASNDYINACILVDRYPGIDPLTGTEEGFWVTLAHRVAPDYMVTRWHVNRQKDPAKQVESIRRHFFFERQSDHRNLENHGLARLWLLIEQTKSDDKKESRILGAKALGKSFYGWQIFRRGLSNNEKLVKAVFRGIIKFEEEKNVVATQPMIRDLGKFLNAVGASRCLDLVEGDVKQMTFDFLEGYVKS